MSYLITLSKHDLFSKYFGEKGMIIVGSLLNFIGLAVAVYTHQD
ncbi:hypothetical protein ACVRW7_01720 [Streptococcus ratti]|nr:hypothetical protein [Streptococcus ratti]